MAGPGALAVKAALGHGLCGAVLELGGVVVHIQLAGDHAVVHLAALVGPLAVVVLKIHIGSDGVDTGAGVGLHLLAEFLVCYNCCKLLNYRGKVNEKNSFNFACIINKFCLLLC